MLATCQNIEDPNFMCRSQTCDNVDSAGDREFDRDIQIAQIMTCGALVYISILKLVYCFPQRTSKKFFS